MNDSDLLGENKGFDWNEVLLKGTKWNYEYMTLRSILEVLPNHWKIAIRKIQNIGIAKFGIEKSKKFCFNYWVSSF